MDLFSCSADGLRFSLTGVTAVKDMSAHPRVSDTAVLITNVGTGYVYVRSTTVADADPATTSSCVVPPGQSRVFKKPMSHDALSMLATVNGDVVVTLGGGCQY
jgi:hypothetical protein